MEGKNNPGSKPEFKALTPDLYSTTSISQAIEQSDPTSDSKKDKKILVIGGGPNRIGQGIEFDYCCVHAAFALKDMEITVDNV